MPNTIRAGSALTPRDLPDTLAIRAVLLDTADQLTGDEPDARITPAIRIAELQAAAHNRYGHGPTGTRALAAAYPAAPPVRPGESRGHYASRLREAVSDGHATETAPSWQCAQCGQWTEPKDRCGACGTPREQYTS